MNYNKKFGFYDSKTGKATIFDGTKRKENGNIVPKIFDGYCSKAVFDALLADDSVSAWLSGTYASAAPRAAQVIGIQRLTKPWSVAHSNPMPILKEKIFHFFVLISLTEPFFEYSL